jgi:hypothetical protein
MFRTLLTTICALLWVRQRFARSRADRSFKLWDNATDAIALKPEKNAGVEKHVAYALQAAEVGKLEARAVEDKNRAAKRRRTYERARDFGPRWMWSLVPYVEIAAAGVAVGWLAHHQPETLRDLLHAGITATSYSWESIESLLGMLPAEWHRKVAAGVGGGATALLIASIIFSRRKAT